MPDQQRDPSTPAIASGGSAPSPATATISTSRHVTEITIPITGTLDRARYYRLADPDGVAINLPDARALVEYGDFRINRDGIQTLWVHEREGGVQVRVVFSHRTKDSRIDLDDDAVRVRLDLD